MTRIVLVLDGRRTVTVHAYKRAMPWHLIERKMAELATELFRSWDWLPGPPGIQGDSAMLIPVSGSDAEVGL